MRRAISTTNADVALAEYGATGRGIVWAIVADGVAPLNHFSTHKNLVLPAGLSHWDMGNLHKHEHEHDWSSNSPLDFATAVKVPAKPGYHATAAASILAGSTDDTADPVGYHGVAPECKIISLNVIPDSESGSEFEVLAALQAIQEINGYGSDIRIHGVLVALSVEFSALRYACGNSPLCMEVDRLVSSGVVVVAPAGNLKVDDDGHAISGSITDPGNARNAITVGATHRTMPEIYGPSYFSARGPTADGRQKPDLLAPGEKLGVFVGSSNDVDEPEYQDGTSYAAAYVAGAAAALLSVHRNLIGRPLEVKKLLCDSAVDLNRDANYQGAGLLDLVGALDAAAKIEDTTSTAEIRQKPLRVFISYSHKDDALWEEFKPHLSALVRTKLISIWSDKAISGGTKWEPQILNELEKSDIVILLVSAHFIASDYAYSKEMGRALAREAEGTARIFPILIRPVDVRGTLLEQFQILPSGMKAITSLPDAHEGWAEVATELRNVVVKLRESK